MAQVTNIFHTLHLLTYV